MLPFWLRAPPVQGVAVVGAGVAGRDSPDGLALQVAETAGFEPVLGSRRSNGDPDRRSNRGRCSRVHDLCCV